MRYVAFDIEISTAIKNEADWWRDDLGIAVAATVDEGGQVMIWHGGSHKTPAERMNDAEAAQLLLYLYEQQYRHGRTVVTWNGLGFDFRILAAESQMLELAQMIALDHVDIMYSLFCDLGYPVSLRKAAKATGIGKMANVSGEDAPTLWASGQYEKVKRYVTQDVKATAAVFEYISRNGYLKWTSNSGREQIWYPSSWPTSVNQAMAQPKPDQSWMSRPIPKERYTQWLKSS